MATLFQDEAVVEALDTIVARMKAHESMKKISFAQKKDGTLGPLKFHEGAKPDEKLFGAVEALRHALTPYVGAAFSCDVAMVRDKGETYSRLTLRAACDTRWSDPDQTNLLPTPEPTFRRPQKAEAGEEE